MSDLSLDDPLQIVNSLKSEWAHLLNEAMAKIEHCVHQLTDQQIWWRPSAELNSVGNLILHLGGNLQQWGVSSQSNWPDLRNRPEEFAARGGVSRDQLLEQLKSIVAAAKKVIAAIAVDELLRVREVQEFHVSGLQSLSHTVSHFVGHTHQVVLLTRIQLKERYQFQWTPDSPRDRVPI